MLKLCLLDEMILSQLENRCVQNNEHFQCLVLSLLIVFVGLTKRVRGRLLMASTSEVYGG
jgi:hypothetical protein